MRGMSLAIFLRKLTCDQLPYMTGTKMPDDEVKNDVKDVAKAGPIGVLPITIIVIVLIMIVVLGLLLLLNR
jgi:hypothetical protein